MSSHNARSKKIAFVVPYPFDTAPGPRFRYEQYLAALDHHGYRIKLFPFLNHSAYRSLYEPGKVFQKIAAVVYGFLLRLVTLPSISKHEFIFIFREAAPVGPPVFEWFIAKVLRKKIIYDFDDAIWLTDNTYEFFFQRAVRWRSKVSSICKWSYKVSCGNAYLCDYAKQFNQNVVLNPTTIDTQTLHNPSKLKKSNDQTIRIGWTGSHSTLKYLKLVESVLVRLEQKFENLRFTIIANRKPDLAINSMEFIPWQKETEAEDLLKIDIGIMPLPDDEWTKGKCGFKALQYMAMEIPTVVSPVGVNSQIVDHGQNGFLANSDNEWFNHLTHLIEDPLLRKKMGVLGREKITKHYSVTSNTSTFLSLFT